MALSPVVWQAALAAMVASGALAAVPAKAQSSTPPAIRAIGANATAARSEPGQQAGAALIRAVGRDADVILAERPASPKPVRDYSAGGYKGQIPTTPALLQAPTPDSSLLQTALRQRVSTWKMENRPSTVPLPSLPAAALAGAGDPAVRRIGPAPGSQTAARKPLMVHRPMKIGRAHV